MTVRVAINGFGRIGRLVLRSIIEHGRTDIEVVAINDLGPVETNAHLFRYDSVHGRFPGTVTSGEDWLDVGTGKIKVTAERDPANLPHAELKVDIAFECTGIFTSKDKASAHLKAGAKRVLVSAPAEGADKTIVYKVNHETLTADDIVVSNGSCTTKALGLVLPELKGKLDGSSIRVPTPNVSVVDLKVVSGRDTSADEINAALQAAADGPMKGVLFTTTDPLVSRDLNHIAASSTAALPHTQVLDGKLARVLSWYDNEWGFATRMADTALVMAKFL